MKTLMLRIKKLTVLIVSILFTINIGIISEEIIKISVPKTLSSIPVTELNNKKINKYKIETNYFQDHIMTMAEFIKGDIDIFMTGFTQGTSAYSNNKNIIHLATPVWGVSSLLTNDKSITELKQLKNKKIAVPFKGSPLEIQLKYILQKENLLNDINIEYAVPQQAVPMLLTKKIDAIAVPEPLVSKLISSGKAYSLFKFSDKWGELNNGEKRSPQVSIFIKKDFAGKNTRFIKELIREIEENINKIKDNPDLISKKYAEAFGLPLKIISRGLKNTLLDIPASRISKDICKSYLKEIGYSKEPDDNFYYKY